MSTLDLTPLEQAAAKAGLPGLEARLVPPNPRRGRLFQRIGHALLVNERVLERLPPAEGQALLTNSILQWKQLSRLRTGLLIYAACALGLGWAWAALTDGSYGWVEWVGASVLAAGWVAYALVGWSQAMIAADDATVTLLGDPEVLVRALNVMNQDCLDLGSSRVEARPDLHRRAERLVDLHQLKLPPERRTVPVFEGTSSCGAGWEVTGEAVGPGA